MTKGQRTIVSMLAAVAVLLGLSLLTDPPEAKAQAGGPVRLVSITVDKDQDSGTPFATYRVFRAFSNGDVDMTWVSYGIQSCDVLDQCGPVPLIP